MTATVALRFCIIVSPNYRRRHCDRSEAIHASARGKMDCFVAPLLAMTKLPPRHHLLDFAPLLLAEEHLLAHEECGRSEGAALDGRLGVFQKLRLDVRLLRAREQ